MCLQLTLVQVNLKNFKSMMLIKTSGSHVNLQFILIMNVINFVVSEFQKMLSQNIEKFQSKQKFVFYVLFLY